MREVAALAERADQVVHDGGLLRGDAALRSSARLVPLPLVGPLEGWRVAEPWLKLTQRPRTPLHTPPPQAGEGAERHVRTQRPPTSSIHSHPSRSPPSIAP